MAVFTAIAAAIGLGKIATAIFVAVGTFATSMVVGRIIAKRAMRNAAAGGDGGGRVQLPPATDNKIPVVYGSAFMGGSVFDAYLSPDQKTMYYAIALAEKTDNGTISFGKIYYDGKEVLFGTGAAVAGLYTNNANPGFGAQLDTRVAGNLFIYTFGNGSTNPLNQGLPAYSIMPNWNSSYAMTNCAFVIVKVQYNVDKGTTNLGSVMAQIVNTEDGQSTGVYRPGTALYDYMTNGRYGCAIPASKVDATLSGGLLTGGSLYDLNLYSDESITYTPVGGGSATQPRYRLNGPLDTSNNCLDNLQNIVDTCDSWLQYSELTGKWKVVINKPFTGAEANLFLVDDSNLVGGIQISPIDLNDTYNELEVAYPNANIKDQTDYQVIELSDYPVIASAVLSPNEAVNRLNLTLGLTNNAVQAKYLGIRRLLQSREDLVISCDLDYSGIQIEAGDVIRVSSTVYGWTPYKLFRVQTVSEEKKSDGTLGASITAFEYNGTIYNDQTLQDFVPSPNTGLLDPNVFDAPIQPIVYDGNIANASTTSFNVEATVPSNGVITYMDFNFGNTSNAANHLLYRTLQPGAGETFTAASNVVINVNDLSAGNLYWSVTARNDFAGRQSVSSNVYAWAGPKVSNYNANTGTGGITGNQIQPNTITVNNFITGLTPIQVVNTLPVCNATTVGQTVYLTTDGKLYNCNGTSFVPTASNTLITGNIVNSQIANIANTKILGEIVEAQIANAAISQDKIAANAVIASKIFANAVTAVKIDAGAVTSDKIFANAVVAGKIDTNAVTAGAIAAGAVTTNTMTANAINGDRITAGTIQAAKLSVSQLDAISAAMGTLTSGTIQTGTSPANRVEISSSGSYPLWYGNGTKDAANARFYLDTAGNAFFAGTLSGAGGTINVDALAIGNSGPLGFLKGAQFILCRDGDTITYPVAYPTGTGPRVSVIFIGGGLTYSNDPNLAPPLYQNFQAFNVTETGFDASLRLQEAYGTGTLTTQSDSFGGGTSVSKSLANVAYDDVYYANGIYANTYTSEYFEGGEGFSSFWYGYSEVSLVADTGSGNVVISPTPLTVFALSYVGPEYIVNGPYNFYGTVASAGAGSDFYLTVTDIVGNSTVQGGTLDYTYSSATANSISATPTGVPAVVALVYLQ